MHVEPVRLLLCLLLLPAFTLTGCVPQRQESKASSPRTEAVEAADAVQDVAADVAETEPEERVALSSQRGGRIDWVVDHGARVKKGDTLVKLAAGDLDQEIADATIASHVARAELIRAEASVAVAEVAIVEYVEGTFPLAEEELKADIAEAELHLKAEKATSNSKERAELIAIRLHLAQKRLEVLRKFTKQKRMTELEGSLKAAKSELQARAENLQIIQSRRDRMLEKLEASVIRSPTNGRVFRADANGIRAGAIVRQGQVLIQIQPEQ